jgi:acetolactate synthase-1/3 small subunit
VTEQLRKLVDVASATCFPATEANGAAVVREFALIRMRSAPENRREIVDVARLFGARIVDVREGSITIEASGVSSAIENILAMLRPLGVEEVARSGGMALRHDESAPPTPPT